MGLRKEDVEQIHHLALGLMGIITAVKHPRKTQLGADP
jgi:hypothetical protein